MECGGVVKVDFKFFVHFGCILLTNKISVIVIFNVGLSINSKHIEKEKIPLNLPVPLPSILQYEENNFK